MRVRARGTKMTFAPCAATRARDRQRRADRHRPTRPARAARARCTRATPTACKAATSAARSLSPASRSLARRGIRARREHAVAGGRARVHLGHCQSRHGIRRQDGVRVVAAGRRRHRPMWAPRPAAPAHRARHRRPPRRARPIRRSAPSDTAGAAPRGDRRPPPARGLPRPRAPSHAGCTGRASASTRASTLGDRRQGGDALRPFIRPCGRAPAARSSDALDVDRSGTSIAARCETTLDLRGLRCPLPALKTRKALTRLAGGDLLVVECTDPLATTRYPEPDQPDRRRAGRQPDLARPVRVPHPQARMIPKSGSRFSDRSCANQKHHRSR